MTGISTELLKKLSSGIDFDKNAKDVRDSLIKSKEQVRKSGYINKKISILEDQQLEVDREKRPINIEEVSSSDEYFNPNIRSLKERIENIELNEATKRMLSKKGVSDKELIAMSREVEELMQYIEGDETLGE